VPSTLWNILLLYQKPQGGFRPIGLLPSIIRLWEYCRKEYLWKWEKENQREYNWAAPGKSSFTVVAHQRLAVEAAGDTFLSSLALLDLIKAYELVPHHRILEGAILYNFPLCLLRVIFSVFNLERHICIAGCYSNSVQVLFSTIIAGSVFGPALLRMSLMHVLDEWHRKWPLMKLYLYIDDMGVLAQGTAHIIKTLFFDAIAHLDSLLSTVDAKLSRGVAGTTGGKSVVLAPAELMSFLTTQFLALGIAVIDHARNLGIDFFFLLKGTVRFVQLAVHRWSSDSLA
jgi:hypothetical protein